MRNILAELFLMQMEKNGTGNIPPTAIKGVRGGLEAKTIF